MQRRFQICCKFQDSLMSPYRAGDTEGPGGGHAPHTTTSLPSSPHHHTHIHTYTHTLFCIAKRKNGNKGKSRKDFKVGTIKRLLTRLKCYCFSHSRAPRIQKVFFSANHGGRQYFPMFLGPSPL